jgi:site-specific DNA recombinase
MLTIGYVRVSTEDQVEHSPEAQRHRCAQYAKAHDLGPIQFLSDEGFSGKNLDRPAMQQLIGLIESGEVASLVVWRLDRLSRDVGDQSRLIKLCERYCVVLHSVNEGIVRVDTASGRMQAGIHGVFAQYYREHVVENVRMGQDQAAAKGRWQNRPPTGYDLVNGELQPNPEALIVQRIFRLRAAGKSYGEIEQATGVKYSTVRHICLNPVYAGFVIHRGQRHEGIHQPLVSQQEFEAVQRVNPTGHRQSKDLVAGKVRCGLCGKVICVERNAKGTAIYRCKHRGKGCDLSGRSAPGLHRAAKLGLQLIGQDR